MRAVVEDVLRYLASPNPVPDTLIAAQRELGDRNLRVVCINLASWWRRKFLLQTQHPYMRLSRQYPWCQHLRTAAELTAELHELLRFEAFRCHFADSLTTEDIAEINAYAQEHYNPQLRT